MGCPTLPYKGSSTICWEVFQDDYDINDVATKVEAVQTKSHHDFFPTEKITEEISACFQK